jgi:predicted permease
MLTDIRYGLRQLIKHPAFTLVAILTLGLGIGANTAIFSIVKGLLLSPLPYRDSERLAIIWTHSPGANVAQDWPSPGMFSAIKASSSVFEALALAQGSNVIFTGQETPERLGAVRASSAVFPLLGVQAALGRVFLPEEDAPGKPPTVILSHDFWQRRFGADPKVLGQQLTLNGNAYTIVGIMPANFTLGHEVMPTADAVTQADLLLPLPLSAERMSNQGDENYNVLARLKLGATIAQAQAELNQVAHSLEQEFPDRYPASRHFRYSIRPLLEQVVGDVRLALYVLLGAVACVLLIACANVANLLLARAAGREKEIAIRSAIGAGRWRVVRQLLTESVLLAILGGALGLVMAIWGLDGLRWLNPGNIPRLQSISIDGGVLAFTSAVVLLTGMLFGLAPALRNLRIDLSATLKEGGRSLVSGQHRLRNLLVIAEIALSLILAIGAGLLIRSFARAERVEPGFAPQHVLSLRLAVFGPAYRENTNRVNFYRQLLERVRRLPGTESAGIVDILPLSGAISWGGITIEGYDPTAGQSDIQADWRTAGVDYFETMKVPLIRGRFFTEQDTKEALPVIVIDENMARTYWPNTDPIGKRVKPGRADSKDPWMTIVGVVGNVKQYALDSDSRVAIYHPYLQDPGREMYLVLRSSANPASLVAAVTREARALEPNVPIYDVKTMEQWLSESLARRRFAMISLGLFAVVAMLLAAVGIYGVMSYTVAQRTPEIGIRVALGAGKSSIFRLIVGQAMTLVGISLFLGVAGAFAATRLLNSLLFGVGASDPATFAGIVLLVSVVAFIAAWLPARRATRVDPIIALRAE